MMMLRVNTERETRRVFLNPEHVQMIGEHLHLDACKHDCAVRSLVFFLGLDMTLESTDDAHELAEQWEYCRSNVVPEYPTAS